MDSFPVTAQPSSPSFLADLSNVSRKLRTLFDARIKQEGLTLTRARLLLQLAREDGTTQRELAEMLEIEPPSVVTLIDALEKKGFLRREMVKEDRRSRRIFLTDKARHQTDQIQRYADQMSQQVLADITEADLAGAARVLQQLTRNIAAL
jgi:MarR family transcriptional regulator for hemolysin